jgi:hypothetical protein
MEEHLNSVQGYQNVLGLVAPHSAQGPAAARVLLSDAWIAEDVSAGGCGVIVPQGKGEGLRVGMLVALRTQAQSSWNVGIIRRVNEKNYRQHQLGIQFISAAALPIHLRTLTGARQGRTRESGILLAEQPSPAGNLYIVIRRDLFSGREPVEALIGAQEASVMLEPGGVVESGHDFDWLYYKFPRRAG